jgi:proteasome lid subunit RPN8/RPN11
VEIHIEAEAEAALRRFAAAGYPDEACGVLIGLAGADVVAVDEATLGRNLRADRARDRYELDPGAIVAAERSARGRGLDIVGFWHSHPDHPARPSEFDTERAWPEYVYVIVATSAEGSGDLRAWMLDEASGRFAAAALTTTSARPR